MTLADLPAVNACLNGLSTIFLSCGYWYIKHQRQDAHRRCMIAAFATSTLFLICYITYHAYVAYYLHRGPTRFLEPQWFRPIYLLLLSTHTILAINTVPLAIFSIVHGLRGNFEAHKRISRWTWPIWMYVSVTGVLIYLLLYQIFPQRPPIP